MFDQTSSQSKSKIRHRANPSNVAPMMIVINVGKERTRLRNIVTSGMIDSDLVSC